MNRDFNGREFDNRAFGSQLDNCMSMHVRPTVSSLSGRNTAV